MKVAFTCAHCGKSGEREHSAINRAQRKGMKLFCDKRCAGLKRRKNKTPTQRRAEKSAYDKRYRAANLALIKAKKAAHFKKTYNPDKARIERKNRAPYHAEYCRRPEYKAWKRWYDAERRAGVYGEFASAYKNLLEVEREIRKRITWHDKAIEKGTLNKAQSRRRSDGAEKRHRSHQAAHS